MQGRLSTAGGNDTVSVSSSVIVPTPGRLQHVDYEERIRIQYYAISSTVTVKLVRPFVMYRTSSSDSRTTREVEEEILKKIEILQPYLQSHLASHLIIPLRPSRSLAPPRTRIVSIEKGTIIISKNKEQS